MAAFAKAKAASASCLAFESWLTHSVAEDTWSLCDSVLVTVVDEEEGLFGHGMNSIVVTEFHDSAPFTPTVLEVVGK